MYRKKEGKRSFSFSLFTNATVPNFPVDSSSGLINELHPHRRDMLYGHQLASKHFYALDERSIYVAGVVNAERASKSAFKALQKNEVLNKEGVVHTTKIGPKFLHQVAMLNAAQQRELINMLFWWEEESQRFSKLWDEDQELTNMIEAAELHLAGHREDIAQKEMVDQLKFARERVRMKIRQRPSQRRNDIETDTDNIMDHFRGRTASAPSQTGLSIRPEGLGGAEPALGHRHQSIMDGAELPKYSER
jgi:hypothetical protein